MPLNRSKDILFTRPRDNYNAGHRGFFTMATLFLFVLAAGYIILKSSPIFLFPRLVVDEPIHGAHIAGNLVGIKGVTDPMTRVTINGFEVYSDEDGKFDLKLPFPKGFQILDVRVANKVGRESRVVHHVIVD